jgi:hypothetical protein
VAHNKYECICCFYGAGRNDFDAGKSILKAIGKGGGLKIETFLCPEMAMSEASNKQ